MEKISQRLVIAFMLLLPALVAAGLLWVMYEKLFVKRKPRNGRDAVRRRAVVENSARKNRRRGALG